MAHNQGEYGHNVTRTDEYGNPIPHTQTDQYGNPNHQPGMGGAYGTGTHTGHGTTTAAGHHGTVPTTGTTFNTTGHQDKEHHGLGHRRSGSSGSSSEDEVDENGVRRKKGMKEKIKEKIPGMGGGHDHRNEQGISTTTPTGGAYCAGEEHPEKKGIMDKIKEKLPGHN